MLTDQLALLLADFFFNCRVGAGLGGIQHGKAHFMTVPRCLGQHAVFTLCLNLNPCVVLRHAVKDIVAFADIHDFIIQQDRIHTSAFKLRGQSLSLQGLVYALLKRQRVHLPYLSYRDSHGLEILPRNHNTAVQRGYMPQPSAPHSFAPLCISKPNPLFRLYTLSFLQGLTFSCSFSLKNKIF